MHEYYWVRQKFGFVNGGEMLVLIGLQLGSDKSGKPRILCIILALKHWSAFVIYSISYYYNIYIHFVMLNSK